MKNPQLMDNTHTTKARESRMGMKSPLALRFSVFVLAALCVASSFISNAGELNDASQDGRNVRIVQQTIQTDSHADQFWKAYSAERHALLSRSAGAGETNSTKYLVFSLTSGGLGNQMAGMMGVFAMSIALGRVFLHDWTERRPQCGAMYEDLFVPPFSPWSADSEAGVIVSEAGGLLPDFGLSMGEPWDGLPPLMDAEDKKKCTINLQHTGIASGTLDRVFIEMKGQDPKPECAVLIITTNQYLAQAVADPGYGAASLGGVPLSQWLVEGSIVETLSAGLFRPVAAVSGRVQDAVMQLYPLSGQTVAAHARAYHLRDLEIKEDFMHCLHDCAQWNNASTIIVATDIDDFVEEASDTLRPYGIEVKALAGVSRTGEGSRMRDTLEKMETALVEMLLIGQADIVITSQHSSFSAVAAASGGVSTQRVGGLTCTPIPNEPELHVLDCGMPWTLDGEKWESVYSFVKSNRERCFG